LQLIICRFFFVNVPKAFAGKKPIRFFLQSRNKKFLIEKHHFKKQAKGYLCRNIIRHKNLCRITELVLRIGIKPL